MSESGGLRQSLPLSKRKSATSGLRMTVEDLICLPKSATIRQSPLNSGKESVRFHLSPPQKSAQFVADHGEPWRTLADHGGLSLSELSSIMRIFYIYNEIIFTLN